jgi:hypothetical protein
VLYLKPSAPVAPADLGGMFRSHQGETPALSVVRISTRTGRQSVLHRLMADGDRQRGLPLLFADRSGQHPVVFSGQHEGWVSGSRLTPFRGVERQPMLVMVVIPPWVSGLEPDLGTVPALT